MESNIKKAKDKIKKYKEKIKDLKQKIIKFNKKRGGGEKKVYKIEDKLGFLK